MGKKVRTPRFKYGTWPHVWHVAEVCRRNTRGSRGRRHLHRQRPRSPPSPWSRYRGCSRPPQLRRVATERRPGRQGRPLPHSLAHSFPASLTSSARAASELPPRQLSTLSMPSALPLRSSSIGQYPTIDDMSCSPARSPSHRTLHYSLAAGVMGDDAKIDEETLFMRSVEVYLLQLPSGSGSALCEDYPACKDCRIMLERIAISTA